MTRLRERMIGQMTQRGFSVRTHRSYLTAVTELAEYFNQSPDQLKCQDIQTFFNHLVQERQLAAASCRLYLNGIRFLYLNVLGWESFDVPVVLPKRPQRIPELLNRGEVRSIVDAISNHKHRTLILTCYGCGLRLSELTALQVRHIDGERRLLRIEKGKAGKDRNVIISDALLLTLRHYWSVHHPVLWLFPNRDPLQPIHIQTAQRIYTKAKVKAGIEKTGGIHALRHAYATHQLEAGMPVHQLQTMLGHSSLRSTMRYIHWVHSYKEGRGAVDDLVASLESANECVG